MIKDLPELKIESGQVIFEKIPTMVVVRSTLSKARQKYFTFLSSEGCTYLKEYLEERICRELPSNKLGREYSGKTLAKLIDEYNWWGVHYGV
ncbi:MAG: hypothetical protein QW282_02570 [Nitrososphaerales archaeon]